MNLTINRLDPNVPDPVESRRRAAGRFVRFTYGATVFGILAFFVIYFGAPLVFLSGPVP
jgi:HlyD family secretion protein